MTATLDRPRAAPAGPPPAHAPRRGVPAPASAWLDAAALLALAAAAAAPLGPYFATSTWLAAGLAMTAVVIVAGTLARQWSSRRWAALAVGVVAALLVVTAVITPGKGLAFLLPTPESLADLEQALAMGRDEIALGVAPMDETPATIALLACSVLLIGVLCFALVAVGAPAVAGLVPLAIWIAPGLVNGADADLLAFLVGGAAWLVLILRPSGPGARRLSVSAVLAGVLALALAAVAAPAAPRSAPIATLGSISSFFDATGIDHTVALGEHLRGNTTAEMLSYVSTAPQYLRMLTLTDFSGSSWSADDPPRTERPIPEAALPAEGQVAVETVIQIAALRSRSLPVPLDTAALAGLPVGWRWNAGQATVSSARDDTGGLAYTATSLVDTPDRADFASASGSPPRMVLGAQDMPADTPAVLVDTAFAVTAGAADDLDRALAIQRWLREEGGFAYSVEAPVRDGFDGSGLEALEAFLDRREGYCVHFASAMAAMARLVGIPARLAIGFAPGDPRAAPAEFTEEDVLEWVVTGQDLHAWPELWFEGLGWVAFEPTPGLGLPAIDPAAPVEVEDEEAAEASSAPTAAPTTAPEDLLGDDPFAADGGVAVGAAGPPWPLLGAILALLLAPAAARALLRRSRLRAGAGPEARWREVLAAAADLGIPLDAAATPREAAAALAARVGDEGARAAIRLLRDAVESRRYGPPLAPGDDAAAREAARSALAALRACAGPGAMAMAALAPRSLLHALGAGASGLASRYAGGS